MRRDMPNLAVLPVVADFTRDFDLPTQIRNRPRVGFFPGSTIGNFDPHDAAEFLRQAGAQSRQRRDHDRRHRPDQGRGGAQCRL